MRKLTHGEFVQRMSEINPNITIIGEYVNAKTKILCKCNIDGNIWSATPDSLSAGRGCPKCGKNYRKNTDEFKEELKRIKPNIEILSEYINDKTKVKCRCLMYGYEWSATPGSLLRERGKGCPKCTHHINKTTEMFIEELSQINSDINILSEYEHCEKHVKCECKICGHIWFATPHNLLHGTGCPICCISKGEKKINTFLKKHNIEFEPQKMYDNLLGVGGKNYLMISIFHNIICLLNIKVIFMMAMFLEVIKINLTLYDNKNMIDVNLNMPSNTIYVC